MIARPVLIAVCAVLGLASAARAQLLVGYDYTGTGNPVPNASQPASFTNPTFITAAGPITDGTGLTPNGTVSNSMSASGFNSADIATANTNGDYFTFTVTPNTTISNVVVTLFGVTSGPGSGGETVEVTWNANGDNFAISRANAAIPTGTAGTVSLPFAPAQSFSAPTTFRIYGFGGSNNTVFSLISSAPGSYGASLSTVPEAETYVLAALGIGLVGFGYYRKRQSVPAFA